MQKKSIYVAYTGGTIGMQRSENGYIPVSGHLQRQLALMPEFHRPEMPDFTIHEYEPLMDSSDIEAAAVSKLPETAEENCPYCKKGSQSEKRLSAQKIN